MILGFRRFPFAVAASGDCTARHLPAADFAERARQALLGGAAVPMARLGEPRQARCGRCSSRSWTGRRSRYDVQGTVRLESAEPFVAFIVGPGDECASCRLAQIVPTPEVISDLERALTRVLEAGLLVR